MKTFVIMIKLLLLNNVSPLRIKRAINRSENMINGITPLLRINFPVFEICKTKKNKKEG